MEGGLGGEGGRGVGRLSGHRRRAGAAAPPPPLPPAKELGLEGWGFAVSGVEAEARGPSWDSGGNAIDHPVARGLRPAAPRLRLVQAGWIRRRHGKC